MVYFAVADGQKTDSYNRTFRGDRERVRQWAAQQALDLVRKKLM
jgi:nicotinamide-nucleotide amidase